MADLDSMHRARQARDQLIARFIDHPAVTLIGIGFLPSKESKTEGGRIIIKIHVNPKWLASQPEAFLPFPAEIDGFQVMLEPGEYHPDSELNSPGEA